jgi:hypothetical protein
MAKMETVFQAAKKQAKKRKWVDPVYMYYDRPKDYADIRRINRLLAPHNMVFKTFSGRGQWRRLGLLVAIDPTKLPARDWCGIADEIICENNGGAQ